MIYRLIIFIICFLWATLSANAQVIARNYESFAVHADKVVRGKVVAAKRLSMFRDNRELPCGVYMEIKVVKSWRGGDENFLLYSTNGDVYLGDKDNDKDREYLIFAFKNKKYNPDGSAEEFILCEGNNSTMKNIAPFEYIDDSEIQMMFPIQNHPSDINEWILVMDRHSNVQLPDDIQKRSVNLNNKSIIEEMSLAQFMDTFIDTGNK